MEERLQLGYEKLKGPRRGAHCDAGSLRVIGENDGSGHCNLQVNVEPGPSGLYIVDDGQHCLEK